ncbi:MAG TPA: hypothetical protein VM658_15615 [bacterium]|nr:hypothetical protein [bacterium]
MRRPRSYYFPGCLLGAACLALIAGGLGAACAAKKTPGPPPAWLDPAAPESDSDYFYGVGCAQKEINNDYLKRDTARERARVDLALNVNQYLVSELEGDTTAARAALEAALPSHEIIDTYADGQGNLYARARLARDLVHPQPAR